MFAVDSGATSDRGGQVHAGQHRWRYLYRMCVLEAERWGIPGVTDAWRRFTQSRFGEELIRLIEGAILLAMFLLLDLGLTALARLTANVVPASDVETKKAIEKILGTWDLGAAAGVVVLFAVHFIAVLISYVKYEFVE